MTQTLWTGVVTNEITRRITKHKLLPESEYLNDINRVVKSCNQF